MFLFIRTVERFHLNLDRNDPSRLFGSWEKQKENEFSILDFLFFEFFLLFFWTVERFHLNLGRDRYVSYIFSATKQFTVVIFISFLIFAQNLFLFFFFSNFWKVRSSFSFFFFFF